MIDNSYLLGLYGSSAFLPTSSGTTGVARKRTDPTPPWDPRAQAPASSDRLRAALAGRRLVDVGAAKLDVPGAGEDYRKLFALYQGLDTLRSLAVRMDTKGVPTTEKSLIERRFAAGLKEVSGFVDGLDLDKLKFVNGQSAEKLKSAGVRRDQREYLGAVVHQGAPDVSVAAFEGDVRFGIDIKKDVGGTVRIDIDLADMGATPRTVSAVIEHVNSKLEAAGVQTRLQRERIPGQPKTVTVGGKPVTLPAGPDQYAIRVKGSTVETVGFSAPDTADAIYLAQRGGKADAGQQQLLKFQTDQVSTGAAPPASVQRPGDTQWVDGRAFQTTLGGEVGAVRATAAAADGSVYVLADVTDDTGGQAIKGAQDVALMKYDSAGKLVWTRTLGAGDTASGFALAVSADGKVAVAGSVTGELDRGDDGLDAKTSDSFVSLYDAEGDEMWTQRRGAREADEASAVAFGADGSVYVAGRARSAMPGAVGAGGYDGYLQGFSAAGTLTFSTQFGGAGDDKATAVTVDGGAVLVGGVEDGHAVVRRFALQPVGAPTLEATRDLGALMGGSVTGLAVDGGRLIVAGSTGNAALSAGTITQAHAGGTDAFVAALDPGLTAAAGDRLTYFGGAGYDGAASMAVSGGKVWLTGSAGTDLPGLNPVGTKDGYLVRLDPTTGAVEWSRRFTGKDGETAPGAIAVGRGAASVLDRLGLPTGFIDQADSRRVVAATALRAGDQFLIKAGASGRGVAVTIAEEDTLADVARKIERASGFRAKVSVVKDGDFDRLEIAPRDTRSEIQVLAGDGGADALTALGLSEGLVRKAGDKEVQEPVYGLELPRDLALDTPAAVKAAITRLDTVMATVRRAYRELVAAGKPEVKPITGEAPAYLQNQLANYQAALSRLGGG